MKLFTKYGAIAEEDGRVLEAALEALTSDIPASVFALEIGIDCGATARGIRSFLEARNIALRYVGIDPGLLNPVLPPFPGAVVHKAKSEHAFHLVPSAIDLVLVDGNHSRNAVILDTFNYESKVRAGGFMLFHDTAPAMQGQDYQYEGPRIRENHVCVNEALELIGFPWAPWFLFDEDWPKDSTRCGMRAYRKGNP